MRIRASFVAVFVCAAAFVVPAAAASPAGAATTRDPVIIVAGTFAGEGTADVYYAPLASATAC